MQRRILFSPQHHHAPIAAVVGSMACISLLASWKLTQWTGGPSRSPESLLLEFLAAFIVTFGALVVAGMIVGLLPIGLRRMRSR